MKAIVYVAAAVILLITVGLGLVLDNTIFEIIGIAIAAVGSYLLFNAGVNDTNVVLPAFLGGLKKRKGIPPLGPSPEGNGDSLGGAEFFTPKEWEDMVERFLLLPEEVQTEFLSILSPDLREAVIEELWAYQDSASPEEKLGAALLATKNLPEETLKDIADGMPDHERIVMLAQLKKAWMADGMSIEEAEEKVVRIKPKKPFGQFQDAHPPKKQTPAEESIPRERPTADAGPATLGEAINRDIKEHSNG